MFQFSTFSSADCIVCDCKLFTKLVYGRVDDGSSKEINEILLILFCEEKLKLEECFFGVEWKQIFLPNMEIQVRSNKLEVLRRNYIHDIYNLQLRDDFFEKI